MSDFAAFAVEERTLIRGKPIHYQKLNSLQNWFPIALTPTLEGIWWRHLGNRRFTESFFSDTLAYIHPEERLSCYTPLEALENLPSYVAPTAFIFHISRCGSTLLTQMLATLPQCIVMSEPPVIDSLLRMPDLSEASAKKMLSGLINALGQQRFHEEQKFFIKFDSWHLCHLPLIRSIFPTVPCILLYRQPIEVLNSHRRHRGPQMIPGWMNATRLNLDTRPLAPGDFDGYCAIVLESYFKCALNSLLSQPLILLNYQQLPAIFFSHLVDFFSIDCSAKELETIQTRSLFNAKHKNDVFTGDPFIASSQADIILKERVAPYYEQLEQARLKQNIF
ncbi:MAG: hypothetical protein V4525_10120 [Pseudomonadota bacterium]